MKTRKIVKVEWSDIAAYHGWKDKGETNKYEPLDCVSCGILVKVKRGNIGLVQSLSETEQTGEAIVIPRKVIKKMETVATFRA